MSEDSTAGEDAPPRLPGPASGAMDRAGFLRALALGVPALGLGLFGGSALAPTAAQAQGRQGRGGAPARKRVLAWADTRNGIAQHESVSHALSVIERLGYDSGTYDTFIRTDSNIISKHPLMTTGAPASGGPSLANVDAIFFMGHREIALTDDQKADLLAFVRDDGKGFVAAHTATTAFLSWPEFGELIGGRYDGHPWGIAPGIVINEDPQFPATKHFPATFPLTDEFYQTMDYSREKIRVLLRLDVSKMPANTGVHRTDGDFPLAWAKMYGKGRVFYSSFGHAATTWDDPNVSKMYFEAIKWSLGLSDADVTPRPFHAGEGRGRSGQRPAR
ncbi:MAG TPA: ThuA domain-containing protein [Gemmatimonadaceae bacterium]|nr:ThuA domain-containing protein [Gemmatimonadaceae bacterium]